MDRISRKALEALTAQLNKKKGITGPVWTRTEKGNRSTVGAYVLDGAYGGVQLQRIVNECGGVEVVSSGGHVPKRALYDQLRAILNVLEA